MAVDKTIEDPLLKVRNISKTFGGTKALDNVSLDFYRGEVHALLGENGAGKSTLIKILSGVYSCQEGKLFYGGEDIGLEVGRLRLAVIHQDLGLAEDMSVTENIASIAGYVKKGIFINWKETRRRAAALLQKMDCVLNPDALVSTLSAADRSLVAISRALYREVDLLILDEPTATLPQKEVERLFQMIETLRKQNIAIIYVSHRMDEVFRISQRVSVLRNGGFISSYSASEVKAENVIADIIGRPLTDVFVKSKKENRDSHVVLKVRDMNTGFVGPVSFELHRGEILALFGLKGAGHNEAGRCIWGAEPLDSGFVYVEGKEARLNKPRKAMEQSIGFISSKRQEEGIAPMFTVRENIYINPTVNGKGMCQLLKEKEEDERCEQAIQKYKIKANSGNDLMGTLSGGNQQKVMIARWFETESKILILEDPTIGVDVGAKADIYNMMKTGLEDGRSILLVSSDCEEVSRIADRVLVFDKGVIIGEVTGEKISMDYLTALSTGVADL
ncbi:sugar ABC transporter ATP-binding protein [Qiania dongpingensis]|uniref:Sugar ABC transporter ATP-binding protein n=1 Tax=Qiania dongpingensis TaxID=2763669 RepID=A0A7G9G6S9_9FIRM|nr:sugar ABC transporter ATP-binding protein [Qiania dongpingensis]QNM06511.1 sugar ABC transporter ATP-binding protein [Qiania dongpingensis]